MCQVDYFPRDPYSLPHYSPDSRAVASYRHRTVLRALLQAGVPLALAVTVLDSDRFPVLIRLRSGSLLLRRLPDGLLVLSEHTQIT